MLHAEKGFYDGGHHNKENAGAEPGGGDFGSVLIAGVPFGIHFNSADQAEDGADGVHQVGAGVKVASYLGIGLVNSGVAILRQNDG